MARLVGMPLTLVDIRGIRDGGFSVRILGGKMLKYRQLERMVVELARAMSKGKKGLFGL